MNKRLVTVLQMVVTCMLTLFVLVNSYNYFFVDTVSSTSEYSFAYPLSDMATYINTLPNVDHVYFYSERFYYLHPALQFLLYKIPGENRSYEANKFSLLKNKNDKYSLFILMEMYEKRISDLKKMYPNGQEILHKDSTGRTLYISYLVYQN